MSEYACTVPTKATGLQWIRLPEGVVYVGTGKSPIRSIGVPDDRLYDWLRQIRYSNKTDFTEHTESQEIMPPTFAELLAELAIVRCDLRRARQRVVDGTAILNKMIKEGEKALQRPLFNPSQIF